MRWCVLLVVLALSGCDFNGALAAYCDGGNPACGGGVGTGDAFAQVNSLKVTMQDPVGSTLLVGRQSRLSIATLTEDGGSVLDPTLRLRFETPHEVVDATDAQVLEGPLDASYRFQGLADASVGNVEYFTQGQPTLRVHLLNGDGTAYATRDGGQVLTLVTQPARGALSVPASTGPIPFIPYNCAAISLELQGAQPRQFVVPTAGSVIEGINVDGGLVQVFATTDCTGDAGAVAAAPRLTMSTLLTEDTRLRLFVPSSTFFIPVELDYRPLDLVATLDEPSVVNVSGRTLLTDGGAVLSAACRQLRLSWRQLDGGAVSGTSFPFTISSSFNLFESTTCRAEFGFPVSSFEPTTMAATLPFSATVGAGRPAMKVSFPNDAGATYFAF